MPLSPGQKWAKSFLSGKVIKGVDFLDCSGGVYVKTPVRLKNRETAAWPYRIEIRNKPVAGTKIPPYTLRMIKSGKFKAGPKTIRALKLFQRRLNYRMLKASGASRAQASKISRHSQEEVTTAIGIYRRSVEGISKGKEVEKDFIIWGLTQSAAWRGPEFWDMYTKKRAWKHKAEDDDDEEGPEDGDRFDSDKEDETWEELE